MLFFLLFRDNINFSSIIHSVLRLSRHPENCCGFLSYSSKNIVSNSEHHSAVYGEDWVEIIPLITTMYYCHVGLSCVKRPGKLTCWLSMNKVIDHNSVDQMINFFAKVIEAFWHECLCYCYLRITGKLPWSNQPPLQEVIAAEDVTVWLRLKAEF